MTNALRKGGVIALCLLLAFLIFTGSAKTAEDRETGVLSAAGKTVLLLGRDDSSGLADAIALVFIDFQNKITLLQIPRDTYFRADEGGYKKINGASKILGSDTLLCKALSEAMGIDIDGYVSFESEFIRDAVDMLGGVEIDIPLDMDYDDPYQGLSIHLSKGKQTLSGSEAVGFVRYRSGYLRADIGRIDAQKLFLAAFANRVLEKIDGKDILPLAKMAVRYLKTDLSISEMAAIGRAALEVKAENISLATLPGEEVRSSQSGAWFYIASLAGCEALLTELGAEEGFDREHLFSDASRKEFEDIYGKEIYARIYSAEEINGEGIEIIPKK